MIVGTDAGTSRNSTVHQNRPYRYPCLTMEEMIAHISLIVSEETFTAISRLYPSLLARTFDKLHHSAKIPVRQLQFRIFCRTADRKHSEKPPAFHSQTQQKFLHLLQTHITMLVDTSHHIKHKSGFFRHHLYCLHRTFKALWISPHPVMICRKSVKADRCRMQSRCQ